MSHSVVRSLFTTAALLALAAALGGCSIRAGGGDSLKREIGSDYFGAGGMLNLTEPVAGDAFLMGGRVAVAGEVKGDLIAAGGELSVGGSVGHHLYAAGGSVKLDAIVTGNARVAGGDVAVGPATVVGGALSLVGGRVDFEGEAHRYLQASGRKVRINGIVHGDARIHAKELVIGPGTQIDGRLAVYGSSRPEIPDGAVIGGGVEFHEAGSDQLFDRTGERVRGAVHGLATLLWLAGVFLAGSLFVFVFPEFAARACETIEREPLKVLALGLVVLICVPVTAVLLVLTVIGIPLALLLVPLYLLLLFLGWVTSALFIGQKAIAAVRPTRPATAGTRLLALLLSLVLLWLVGRIPHLGPWVRFVVLLLGIGALAWQFWNRRDRVLRAAA